MDSDARVWNPIDSEYWSQIYANKRYAKRVPFRITNRMRDLETVL